MKTDGWIYYNHAMIPKCSPHEEPDISCIQDDSVWFHKNNPMLARWTTDFDCGYETDWWYCIKDEPFDISTLKAKRRYEINKGSKNFDVREININDYINEIYEVTKIAYMSWPEKYRPDLDKNAFFKSMKNQNIYKIYGAFSKQDGKFCAYALLSRVDKCVNFNVLRVIPDYERCGINAAMVFKILDDHNEFLSTDGYICDGARSINHETAFQDYLEKYFDFRKAYCKLHVVYNPKLKNVIKLIYKMRSVLKCFDNIRIIHQINSVLKMEEIVQKQNNE